MFWSADLAQGRPVYKHYKQIKNHFNHSIEKKILQPELKNLLVHATLTTPFYKKLICFNSLSDFPVINKTIIRELFNDFLSGKFYHVKLIPIVTSGSTGTPFRIFQDKNKKYRNYADTIFFARLAGYEIGHKLLYLKIWAKQKMKNQLVYWLQNIQPVDVIKLDDQQIQAIIKEMESNNSNYGILGYSSALELVCRFLEKYNHNKIKTNIQSIITISESLNEYTKITLEKHFGMMAVSRYSNLENGIIAQQQTNNSSRFLVNTASYYVEILKLESDKPANEGELGRIVITDLYNYALPMIRYDTGDIGALEYDKLFPNRLYLSLVEGRKLDMLFDTKGNLVSSFIMYKNMWQYTDIKQYQLIQEGAKEYKFKINADSSFNSEAKLVNEFKTYLGEDAVFEVEYVSEIPLLNSGKRKKLVNNYRQS